MPARGVIGLRTDGSRSGREKPVWEVRRFPVKRRGPVSPAYGSRMPPDRQPRQLQDSAAIRAPDGPKRVMKINPHSRWNGVSFDWPADRAPWLIGHRGARNLVPEGIVQ